MSRAAAPAAAPAAGVCPYRLVHTDREQLAATSAGHTLGSVVYGAQGATNDPWAHVPLPVLAGAPAELWLGQTLQRGMAGAIRWNAGADLLFAHMNLPESSLGSMESAVHDAYVALDELLRAEGFPHPLRIWNYLSAINQGDGDAERYRRMSVGRHRALARHGGFERTLPAASTIGTPAGSGLQIHLIAARSPGLQVENPVQLSAFRYPRDYGPRSPSFSRAVRVEWDDQAQLLVSGTASIVGHESRHAGDLEAQLEQTLANLQTLCAHAARPGETSRSLSGKVYLRHAQDLPLIAQKLERTFAGAPVQVLQGDICRRELLVEIEAIYSMERTPA